MRTEWWKNILWLPWIVSNFNWSMDRLTHNEFEHVLCISAAATKVYGVRVLNCRVFREIEGATTWKNYAAHRYVANISPLASPTSFT